MANDYIEDIVDMLAHANSMTIATIRPDRFPQATTVNFVNDGTDIYFGCRKKSHKANNIKQDDKVSCTINTPCDDWNKIRGLSVAGRAAAVSDFQEAEKVERLFVEKFLQFLDYAEMPKDDMIFVRIRPSVVSIVDYSTGLFKGVWTYESC